MKSNPKLMSRHAAEHGEADLLPFYGASDLLRGAMYRCGLPQLLAMYHTTH